jgi:sulfatase maturation enzyme AslB (radical SAM superfamily)
MCRECRVLPQCAGGCAHKRLFQSDGLHDEDFCYWHLRGDLENRIREVALNKKAGATLRKMVKTDGQNGKIQ